MRKELAEVARKVFVGLAVRAGTASAVWLAAYGVPQELLDQVQAASVLVAGLLFDLAMVLVFKGKVK